MEQIFNSEFLLRENESPLCAFERIREHPHFPYLQKSDFLNIILFLNRTSTQYSKSDIKYELYWLFISYYILPSPYATCRIGEIYMFGVKKKKWNLKKLCTFLCTLKRKPLKDFDLQGFIIF